MRKTKKSVQSSIEEIMGLIDVTVQLEQQLQALETQARMNRELIKSELIKRGLDRQVTLCGCEALVIKRDCYSWSVDQLKQTLDPDLFAKCCPPKPDYRVLAAALQTCPDKTMERKLLKCAEMTEKVALELRAPAERLS